jgi:AraC family transcriptional regulator of adaptative response/methylated-DNA-[protein]-cysteine methyltransferase
MAKAKRTINWTVAQTSLGPVLVAATAQGVCRLAFDEGPSDLARHYPDAELVEGGDGFPSLAQQVVRAIEDPSLAGGIPLDLAGTVFQQAVWAALRAIPSGETRTYAQIAAAAGRPSAVRAAGSANGANPVAVLVPCHRVVRSDGSLGGYAYGPEIKRALLQREGAFALV